jgi:hypothetical protein
VGVLVRATRWEEGGAGPWHRPGADGGKQQRPTALPSWRAWVALGQGGGVENGSPTCGPRGHSAMIQTKIQMISNKLKIVQTSFDPKGTFLNLIF